MIEREIQNRENEILIKATSTELLMDFPKELVSTTLRYNIKFLYSIAFSI
jgi:hypothetical protein